VEPSNEHVQPSSAHHRPFLLGVAGGTCSGKTTVAERLCELIGGDRIALIKLDSYYVDTPHEPLDVRAKLNYDHPDAFDWELLNRHMNDLVAGRPIEVPVYDYAGYARTDQVTHIGRCDVVVVEGILVLWEPSVRELFDLKVYVDADADLRLIRRLQRDVTERGRSPDSIIDQYLTTVRPSHLQFIEPSKRYANVIFPEGGQNEPALEVLLARVRELLQVS
jgi:uridine kinase